MVLEEKAIAKKLFEDYKSQQGGEVSHEILTREYKIFIAKKTSATIFYEKLAQLSGKFFKYHVDYEQKVEIDTLFKSFDYAVTAEEAMSLSVTATVTMVILGVLLFFVSMMYGIAALAVAVFLMFYLRQYPQRLAEIRRAKASTEIILSVLYVVIYMKTVSNLEAAIRFASDNLEGPLGMDYRKLLWDVSSKKYADVQEALDTYLKQWKKYNEAFVDSMYLIETSLVQISDERRVSMLDQALKRILDGTYEQMVHYVNDLRTPVSAVFMLGITLPIMGIVMLPLLGAFLANLVTAPALFVFYDILLPFAVIILIMQILATRPSAFPQIDLSEHPLVPPKDHFYFFGRLTHAATPAAIVFAIVSSPFFYYIIFLGTEQPSEFDIFFSLFLVLAMALAIAIYAHLSSGVSVKIRKDIKDIEGDFGYAVFQISNRLSEGVPAEIAMIKTAATMKESKVARLIKRIADNIAKLGMDLRRAIFDKVHGAIIVYPSSLIRSVMRIFVESTKESEEIAATSMMHVAHYLQSVHQIEEKIQDVLSETISSLKFQAMVIAPLISGIIVGLTSMIMIILFTLGEKISAATAFTEVPSTISGSGGLGGTMAFGFFEMSNTIPLGTFQIIIGIYVIEILIISMVLASKIEVGDDRINELSTVSKSLFIAIIIYFVVAFGVTIAFSGMAKVAILLGEFG